MGQEPVPGAPDMGGGRGLTGARGRRVTRWSQFGEGTRFRCRRPGPGGTTRGPGQEGRHGPGGPGRAPASTEGAVERGVTTGRRPPGASPQAQAPPPHRHPGRGHCRGGGTRSGGLGAMSAPGDGGATGARPPRGRGAFDFARPCLRSCPRHRGTGARPRVTPRPVPRLRVRVRPVAGRLPDRAPNRTGHVRFRVPKCEPSCRISEPQIGNAVSDFGSYSWPRAGGSGATTSTVTGGKGTLTSATEGAGTTSSRCVRPESTQGAGRRRPSSGTVSSTSWPGLEPWPRWRARR